MTAATLSPARHNERARDHLATLCENFNDNPPACPVDRLLALDEIRRVRRELETATADHRPSPN